MLLTSNPEPAAFADEERAAVLEQLERMLASPYFSHSRRFPALLRFVVESTLSGQGDVLKERTLGVEIFGKRAHYDTANDPIVRVTAAEIRKRLALYYGEPGHSSELRVSLPAGSYVPQFEWPRTLPEHSAPDTPLVESPNRGTQHGDIAGSGVTPATLLSPNEQISIHRVSRTPNRRWTYILAGLTLLLLVAGGVYWWTVSRPNAVQVFWAPVLDAAAPVLFCVADQTEYTDIQLRDAAQPAHMSVLRDSLTAVIIDDIPPIADIAGILRQSGKQYTIRGEGATTLNDLRGASTIFIGAYDNAWTLRLLEPLRFHFANNPEMTRFWVVDRKSDKPPSWAVDRREQIATNVYRDYAIVSRFIDSDTGRLSIVVAGIGRGGTIAAGEFLTSPVLLQQLGLSKQRGKPRNLEIVLSTQIIGGQPGAPRVEASYSW